MRIISDPYRLLSKPARYHGETCCRGNSCFALTVWPATEPSSWSAVHAMDGPNNVDLTGRSLRGTLLRSTLIALGETNPGVDLKGQTHETHSA